MELINRFGILVGELRLMYQRSADRGPRSDTQVTVALIANQRILTDELRAVRARYFFPEHEQTLHLSGLFVQQINLSCVRDRRRIIGSRS